ncbi:MAG: hypothetical protein RR054_03660 [Clostridia bacterium]
MYNFIGDDLNDTVKTLESQGLIVTIIKDKHSELNSDSCLVVNVKISGNHAVVMCCGFLLNV